MPSHPTLFNALIVILSLLASACGTDFDLFVADGNTTRAQPRITSNWDNYGGPGGRKSAEVTALTKQNIGDLELAWVYRTGEVESVFQTTPVLIDGQLVFCSPHNRVIALDPLTGVELWTFDPEIDILVIKKYSDFRLSI